MKPAFICLINAGLTGSQDKMTSNRRFFSLLLCLWLQNPNLNSISLWTNWTQIWWRSQHKNNNSIDFYYYSKYEEWPAVQTQNQLIATQLDSTELNSTEKSRIKSKQNLSVSLSPEVWQKCFDWCEKLANQLHFLSLCYCLGPPLTNPLNWQQLCSEGKGVEGGSRSFLKADWSFRCDRR